MGGNREIIKDVLKMRDERGCVVDISEDEIWQSEREERDSRLLP